MLAPGRFGLRGPFCTAEIALVCTGSLLAPGRCFAPRRPLRA